MILDKIVEVKKMTLESELEAIMPKQKGKIYSMIKAKKDVFVIGEIKKASPSKGVLIEDFNLALLAKEYDESCINALSVLTEKNYFLGNIQYLKEVRQLTKKPILRKDFIIDSREIIQAKQMGADLVLLIAAILDDQQLKNFYMSAYALGLECIVEVHNEEELTRVLAIQPEIIGINNRDLKTFNVSLETTAKLAQLIPNDIAIISESGIHSYEDVQYLKKLGIDGVLIGESFMKCENIQNHYESLGFKDVD